MVAKKTVRLNSIGLDAMILIVKLDEILRKVKELELPKGSYVLFGGCPMAAVGLREANDIDMIVTPEVYEAKKEEGWEVLKKGPKDTPVTKDVFEMHKDFDFSTYETTLDLLLKNATVIDGVPFASLQEIRGWKAASKDPKHGADIALIDEYLLPG